jgi:DNA helicase-2/ATP-dependent DNA helicase PcrA
VPDQLISWRRLPEPAMAMAAQRIAPVGGFAGRRAAGPGLRPVVALDPGDRVTHSAWGLGTVVSTSGDGDKARARIDFGGEVGVKELLLRYAPVEKL